MAMFVSGSSTSTGSFGAGYIAGDATFAGVIRAGSLEYGNGFWRNTNVVSRDFTVPTGEIWKSFNGINVNTGVTVTVNGTWTLTSGNFGET